MNIKKWLRSRKRLPRKLPEAIRKRSGIFGKNVHTSYAIPSKVVDYLRFRMPVIVTKDMGSFTDVVIRYKLGRVIDREEELVDAIDSIKCSYNDYGTNIDEYFAQFPFDNFTDYLIENCAPLGNR